MSFGFNETFISGFLLSGKKKWVAISTSADIMLNTANTYLQLYSEVRKPPSVGAMIGDTPTTNINSENTFALSSTGKRSLTIARDATMPAQLPSACKNRSQINASPDFASMQPIEAIK